MDDGSKIFAGVGISIAVTILAIVLLMVLDIPMWLFLMLIAFGVIVVFLPMGAIKGDWASLDEHGIRIKAPFVDLSIPFSSILAMEMVTGFKPGIRIFGLGLIRRGSGDFTNDTLGSYTFAGTTAVDRMIVVRYSDRKNRIVAFNLPSVEATEALFSRIKGSTGAGPLGFSASETESCRRSHRSVKKAMIGISVISVITVVVIMAFAMNTGHADAYLEEDALVIDATQMHRTIEYDEISDAELRYDMDYGIRTGGIANKKILSGNFRNEEFGNYHLAVNKGVSACIAVFTDGKTKVFNLHSDEETESFFLDLQTRLAAAAGSVVTPSATSC